jgi:L-threonylcarbamoyladenylate synthase
LNPKIYLPSNITISSIGEYLLEGNLVAIPTETVYGLAANACDENAIDRIFQLKNRPNNHPLIVHIASPRPEETKENFWEKSLSSWSNDVPPEAIALATRFWPGPLTLILKKAKNVSSKITGGQNTVAVRAPKHPWTIKILQYFKNGLVAPSANRFGHISPTTAQHVYEEFYSVNSDIEMMILDGGPCEVGIESTILDLTRLDELGPVILRPGMILENDVCACLGLKSLGSRDESIRHSGGHLGHYAPRTQLIIQSVKDLKDDDFSQEKICVVTFMDIDDLKIQWPQKLVDWVKIPLVSDMLAKLMYELLRELDKKNYKKIIFDQIPNGPEWVGIIDRLNRSSYGSGNINH